MWARRSDTKEIWSAFFDAVEFWVRTIYLIRVRQRLYKGMPLTPISFPIPSGACARGRAQTGSPSCCVVDVQLVNPTSKLTVA